MIPIDADKEKFELLEAKGSELRGKRILVCSTGSIAVLEVPHLVRELIRHGADVTVVLSAAAQKLVGVEAFRWASKKPPITEITGQVEHVLLGSHPELKADLCLVVPATINTIGKVAHGIADTPVTLMVATCLGAKIPVMMVPTAHQFLLDSPIVQENKKKLSGLGVLFLEPRYEEGKAKIPETEEIVRSVIDFFRMNSILVGRRVLITTGATREYLDDVRFISNPSSGKTGLALARMAQLMGAEKVKVILGEGHTVDFRGFDVRKVVSANEMVEATLEELDAESYDVVISAAAIADYMVERSGGKIPSLQQQLELKLKPTRKLLKEVREAHPEIFLVGYKSEVGVSAEELVSIARSRIKRDKLDMVVANEVKGTEKGFARDTNEIFIVMPGRDRPIHIQGTKEKLAAEILRLIAMQLEEREMNDFRGSGRFYSSDMFQKSQKKSEYDPFVNSYEEVEFS